MTKLSGLAVNGAPALTDTVISVEAPGSSPSDVQVTIQNLLALSGNWQAWTPTWAGTTVGNGTVVARYTQIGKTVHFQVLLTFGSTTTFAGTGVDTTFTPPTTPKPSDIATNYSPIGNCTANSATGFISGVGFTLYNLNTNLIVLTVFQSSGIGTNAMNSANVSTPATGGCLWANGTYETT